MHEEIQPLEVDRDGTEHLILESTDLLAVIRARDTQAPAAAA